MNRIVPLAALALLAVVRPWPMPEPVAPLAAERELASLVPERCLVYVEADGLRPLLELGLDHPFVRELLASELGRSWTSALPLSPADAIARADAWLGASALQSAADVAEHGLALGFDPAAKKAVLVARGHDADSVARALALVLDALERQFGWPGAFDAPHARWSGADVWMLGEAVVARRDELLVLGNERELVAEALELAADPDGRGLLARAGVAEHLADRPSGIALWSWLELAALEPFADAGFRALRASNRAPAAQAILGARIAALVSARALSAALELGGGPGLALHLCAVDAAPAATLTPLAREGAMPAELDGPGLARALVYRDWGRYFTQRTELFPAEVLPKFAEAVTNGALFFEGQDLGEEVLGRLSPWLRIVSRAPEFAADRRPEIPLPAAAVVAVLDDERAGEAWSAAFQSIVSIVNVDRAQKGQASLRLHLESEGEVEISAARFAAPAPGEGVDVRYNLEPALAVVGRHLVLGTHASLVHALVRELAGKAPLAAGEGRETLELDARGWRELLERNFETLVANKMVAEGRTHAAAEQEIGGLRHALATFEGARLELGGAPDAPELALELRLARAETPR